MTQQVVGRGARSGNEKYKKTNLLLTNPVYIDQQKTEHDPGTVAPKAQDARRESVGIRQACQPLDTSKTTAPRTSDQICSTWRKA